MNIEGILIDESCPTFNPTYDPQVEQPYGKSMRVVIHTIDREGRSETVTRYFHIGAGYRHLDLMSEFLKAFISEANKGYTTALHYEVVYREC